MAFDMRPENAKIVKMRKKPRLWERGNGMMRKGLKMDGVVAGIPLMCLMGWEGGPEDSSC